MKHPRGGGRMVTLTRIGWTADIKYGNTTRCKECETMTMGTVMPETRRISNMHVFVPVVFTI
jgi:hypothetical protein